MSKFKPTIDQLFAALKRCDAAQDQVGVQRAADEMIERAFEALELDQDEEATQIGRKLQQVDHPTGYEIEALVLDRVEQADKAISVLEGAVKKIPTSWRLWEMLGNLLSDSDRFEDAFKAYDKALSCPDFDEASVRFNLALTQARAKHYEEALKVLEPVDFEALEDGELRLNALAFKASVLNALERFGEAAKLAKDVIAEVGDGDFDEETIPHLAEIHAQLARSVLEGERDKDKALSHALDAIRIDQGNDLALQLLRAIRGKTSASASLMQITVKGLWPEPFEGESERREFRQTFAVVANSQEEAMDYLRELTPEELRGALAVEECETVQQAPDEPVGVCQASPFIFFTGDEEGEPKGE